MRDHLKSLLGLPDGPEGLEPLGPGSQWHRRGWCAEFSDRRTEMGYQQYCQHFTARQLLLALGTWAVLLLLFVIWMCITTYFAFRPDLAVEQLDKVLKIQFMTFVTLIMLTSRERLHALVWTVALSLGFITLRMGGHYLPLGTIAWGISLYFLFGNVEFLGGHTGITGIPAVSLAGWELKSGREFFYLIWLVVLLAIVSIRNLLDSRVGRAIRALKGGTVMAEAMGVNTPRAKIVIFLIASRLNFKAINPHAGLPT